MFETSTELLQMLLDIKFSNPNGVYHPGTQVTGTVALNLESSVKVSFTREFGGVLEYWTFFGRQ